MLLSKALAVGEELVALLRDQPSALDVELAGSARRWADDVKDLDIVAASSDPDALVKAFCASPAIDVVHSSGPAGARVLTHSGLPVDLRIVPEEAFGNLLQHFTGSGRHNEALRTAAVKRGLHVSEYGIADDESGDSIAYAHRGGGLRAARHAVDPAGAARGPRRAGGGAQGQAAAADRAGRHPRRPAHAHDRLGRPRLDRGDGRDGARARLRVRRDHRPLGQPRLRRRRAARRAAAPGRAHPRRWRSRA